LLSFEREFDSEIRSTSEGRDYQDQLYYALGRVLDRLGEYGDMAAVRRSIGVWTRLNQIGPIAWRASNAYGLGQAWFLVGYREQDADALHKASQAYVVAEGLYTEEAQKISVRAGGPMADLLRAEIVRDPALMRSAYQRLTAVADSINPATDLNLWRNIAGMQVYAAVVLAKEGDSTELILAMIMADRLVASVNKDLSPLVWVDYLSQRAEVLMLRNGIGDIDRALQDFESARLVIALLEPDSFRMATSHYQVGLVYRAIAGRTDHQSDYNQAIDAFNKARAIYARLGFRSQAEAHDRILADLHRRIRRARN